MENRLPASGKLTSINFKENVNIKIKCSDGMPIQEYNQLVEVVNKFEVER